MAKRVMKKAGVKSGSSKEASTKSTKKTIARKVGKKISKPDAIPAGLSTDAPTPSTVQIPKNPPARPLRSSKKDLNSKPLLVVAIGAAAGGFNAIRKFLEKLGDPQKVAVVIVQHLDESVGTLAHEVLAQQTKLSVRDIQAGDPLRGGVLFRVPPHATVSLRDGVFEVEALGLRDVQFSLIDHFFRSLATDQRERAVGIVLSGDGSDGAQGVKTISDGGGMALAQMPESAEFASMPLSAIATGGVDHVLPVEDMPLKILSYATYLEKMFRDDHIAHLQEQIIGALTEICEILHRITRHDFKHYKSSTLARRIQRRMQVLQISAVDLYVDRLNADVKEADALFKELLINVTCFFRDADAFATLKEDVLLKALKDRPPDQKYRVWVAGCSTGEEVYSIAMLVKEIISKLAQPPEVQIIATDIDEVALNQARKGSYPSTITEHVSPARLRRFFERRGGRFIVTKELREIVLFSSHNLINDPPFSQLDLISCRNVLIYLGPHLQKKLIPVFHYALRKGGCLFLGNSESLASHKELFRALSTKHRIAQRKATSIRPPGFSLAAPHSYVAHAVENVQSHETDVHLISQRILLDEFAPKYAVVNDDCQIVSVSAGVAQYLDPAEGAFQNNLLKLVQPGLRVGLRSAFNEAKKAKRRFLHQDSTLKIDAEFARIGITVQPMPQLGDEGGLYMVVFHYFGSLRSKDAKDRVGHQDLRTDALVVDQLERELGTLRADLDRSIEDLEASNEELKSSNEELLSMNEELQSANEELETSKEEVQSANDALQRNNTDLENLLASTEIATLFLDRSLQIQSYTPQLESIYNISKVDIGRPIGHLTSLAKAMPPLPDPAVFDRGTALIENDIELTGGRWMLRRILPYRTAEGTNSGIVVTFIDVTHLRVAEERYRQLAESMPQIVWTAQPDGTIDYFNERWYEFSGRTRAGAGEQSFEATLHPDDRRAHFDQWQKCLKTGQPFEVEHRFKDARTGTYRSFLTRAVPALDSEGRVTKWYGSSVDINDRVVAEQMRRESERRFQIMADTAPVLIWISGVDKSHYWFNKGWLEWVGRSIEQEQGNGWSEGIHPEDADRYFKTYLEDFDARREFYIEYRLKHRSGEYRWISDRGVPRFTPDGTFEGYIGGCMDIHDAKMAREHLLAMSERSKNEIENERLNFRNLFRETPEMVCILFGPEHVFEFCNDAHVRALGFDATGMSVREAQPESVEVFDLLDGVYCTGITAKLEEIPITLGTRLRYFDLTYAARRDRDGNINGVMILGVEITEKMLARADLRLAKEESERARQSAESANESKTRFLANMSHEIRTPLAAILGFSELLQGRTHPDDAAAAEQLHRISRNAAQLGRLIDELLDLSKIEAEKLIMDRTDFDLLSALDDALSSVMLRAREKGLSFDQRAIGEVPRTINTDRTRFCQVLTNIIGNAVKFTESGGIEVEFESEIRGDRRFLKIRVKDTGIGLSPQQQSRIFEPFVQADTSVTRKYGGTGLGLVLAKRLAQLMGGDLSLEWSALGKGSSFLAVIEVGVWLADVGGATVTDATGGFLSEPIDLSLARNDRSVDQPERRKLNGKHILIVDDSVDNQQIITLYLKAVGAVTEVAGNGHEACEKMKVKAYDLVLMDIQMPILDGYRALTLANENGYRGPIVALTAHAMKEEKDRCLEAGFTDYLSKPIDRQKLINRIYELVN